VRRRLDNPSVSRGSRSDDEIQINDAMAAEIGDTGGSQNRISQVMDSAVQWQLDNHQGFVSAFVSAIRHAPITAQFEMYSAIGARLNAQNAAGLTKSKDKEGLVGGKVILVLGAKDSIVIPEEQEADHKSMLGEGNVETIIMDAGHDVPIAQPDKLTQRLWDVWQNFGVV
jgi:pimeloyl-ACP methyl ester carboxylesterase